LSSDAVTVERIQKAKADGQKPVIFGEQGNAGQNWDDRSALRMRIRSWTAFFNEGSLIFWNSSFAKDYQARAANIYLGPPERMYIANLQTFTKALDADVRIAAMTVRPARNHIHYTFSSISFPSFVQAAAINSSAPLSKSICMRIVLATPRFLNPSRTNFCQALPYRIF